MEKREIDVVHPTIGWVNQNYKSIAWLSEQYELQPQVINYWIMKKQVVSHHIELGGYNMHLVDVSSFRSRWELHKKTSDLRKKNK